MDQCVVKISLVALLFFSFGACYPSKTSGSGQTGPGFDGSTSRFGSGRGSTFDEQDSGPADAMTFKPERPFPRFAWTSEQVPLGMVERRPLYPSSHVVIRGRAALKDRRPTEIKVNSECCNKLKPN
ncbi:hypothetical protein OJAV_G00187280 [Oryzias javanicus]|uniref:Secreted protein n=1 Tax=Oryzias javanicus TaxID=123683 RepID=A0A3S2P7F1_ORYJA|nr:hypothetical protein OJAV_G00187280 [Oryzias javanicus]